MAYEREPLLFNKKKNIKIKNNFLNINNKKKDEETDFYSIPRNRSFPNDIFSGTRYRYFYLEEKLRKRDGKSILSWLYNTNNKNVKDENNELNKNETSIPLESFDYDGFESRVNMKHDFELTEAMIRSMNIGRWIMTFSIGLCTALVACFIETFTRFITNYRINTMNDIILMEKNNQISFGMAFLVYLILCCSFVFIASYSVAILCPVAGGSGISEIKATLNGIKIPRVVRLKTLFCKGIGVLFSVAGGLPVGKEGPMIHSGAIIGAGLSQGKSSSFGLDTSWTKFKGFRNDKEKRDFISCGAAAGVTAAFGAPIGGVLFALEEGASFWHQNLTWRTFFCAMVAAFIFNLFLSLEATTTENENILLENHRKSSIKWGELGIRSGTFSFGMFSGDLSYSLSDLFIFVIMGSIGGLWGAFFNQMNMYLTKFRYKHIKNRWFKLFEASFIAAIMASISFWTPYFFGTCLEKKGPYIDSLISFYCQDDKHYNDLASLFTVSYSSSIKQLLHFASNSDMSGSLSFTPVSLIIFFLCFSLMSCWTYGLSVPSGLFVPSLLAGAAYGRICVYFLHWIGISITATDGMFALIGAASVLGGMARMTISLTVIILECTGVLEWGLPIMLSLMAARWVGNSFNEGLYDIHIHLRKWPFLEYDPPFYSKYLQARHIMSHNVIELRDLSKVGDVYDILSNCDHSGFPVVQEEESISENKVDKSFKSKPKFVGVILRKHLAVLLQKKDFFIEKPIPYTREPAGETTFLYNEQYALSYREIESNYPRYPTMKDIRINSVERNLWLDLTPYMNPTPHTVQENTPVPRAFRLFRSLGLRHLIVLNGKHEVCGIITRKDLTPNHLKICLEGLSENEKKQIQGYFTRKNTNTEKFDKVEKTLLKIIDNS